MPPSTCRAGRPASPGNLGRAGIDWARASRVLTGVDRSRPGVAMIDRSGIRSRAVVAAASVAASGRTDAAELLGGAVAAVAQRFGEAVARGPVASRRRRHPRRALPIDGPGFPVPLQQAAVQVGGGPSQPASSVIPFSHWQRKMAYASAAAPAGLADSGIGGRRSPASLGGVLPGPSWPQQASLQVGGPRQPELLLGAVTAGADRFGEATSFGGQSVRHIPASSIPASLRGPP